MSDRDDHTHMIRADEAAMAICKAMGIDHRTVTRIILDLPAGGLAAVHVIHVGTEELVDANVWEALRRVEPHVAHYEPKRPPQPPRWTDMPGTPDAD